MCPIEPTKKKEKHTRKKRKTRGAKKEEGTRCVPKTGHDVPKKHRQKTHIASEGIISTLYPQRKKNAAHAKKRKKARHGENNKKAHAKGRGETVKTPKSKSLGSSGQTGTNTLNLNCA